MRPAQRFDVYRPVVDPIEAYLYGGDGKQPGDPAKAAEAMIAVVESDDPPLRLLLGADAIGLSGDEASCLLSRACALARGRRGDRLRGRGSHADRRLTRRAMRASPIALVTGGNRGIGLEVCRQLAQNRMRVLLGARDPAKGEKAAQEMARGGL